TYPDSIKMRWTPPGLPLWGQVIIFYNSITPFELRHEVSPDACGRCSSPDFTTTTNSPGSAAEERPSGFSADERFARWRKLSPREADSRGRSRQHPFSFNLLNQRRCNAADHAAVIRRRRDRMLRPPPLHAAIASRLIEAGSGTTRFGAVRKC